MISTLPPSPMHSPPTEAALLYDGQVMHARLKPKGHRFAYQVYSLMIDLMRLPEASQSSRLFSVGSFNLLSFYPSDHGTEDGADLASYVRNLLAEAGMIGEPARLLLVCYPRVLGFTFNPISVYFAYDQADQLLGVIYEVRNTFGDKHTYVAPVLPDELNEAGLRQERQKLFYVSPFMDMDMTYRFRIRPPGDDCAIRILEFDHSGPMLAASFHGRRKPLTGRGIIRALARNPFLPIKVVGGIHWEAAKLWFKGIRFFSRPLPPPPVSINGHFKNPAFSKESNS